MSHTYTATYTRIEAGYMGQVGMLKETASMPDEDEWMEWKGVAVMLEAWQQALRDILDSAHLKL